jgi:hypothetical protein
MYLGTGWSLIFFTYPIQPQLTVDNYYLVFVPEVKAAAQFFTYMTALMLLSCVIMGWAEWKTRFRWVPLSMFLLVSVATLLTLIYIFPYNKILEGPTSDPVLFKSTLQAWINLNWIRVSLWTLQWLVMMFYFAAQYLAAPGEAAE